MQDLEALLQSIRPTHHARIMDLVAEAGVSVEVWARRRDGSIRENPADNPSFCYEWIFGGGNEPTVLCVWYDALRTSSSGIEYNDNYRELAIRLDRISDERFTPAKDRSRAKSQAPRAQDFDRAVQAAFRQGRPLRIITLVGEKQDSSQLEVDASKVEFRLLDTEPWHVARYGDDGSFVIRRGSKDPVAVDDVAPANQAVQVEAPAYVDQFSSSAAVERRESIITEFVRSSRVRVSVLRRAEGRCEYCGTSGFVTASGSIYLETHHIIPLSENGPDNDENVVALCPNDHRQAHFGTAASQMRAVLAEIVSGKRKGRE
jgi:5-methylcytosine-specific restriction enzyme A